jgi:hypothetical protein
VLIDIGKVGEFRDIPYSPLLCPRCLGELPVGYPGALSRVDNETEICSACGTDEALTDYYDRFLAPIKSWPIKRTYELNFNEEENG